MTGLLPAHHELWLLDLNVEEATDEHWRWADMVQTAGMMIQRPSVVWIIEQCLRTRTSVVVGGPDATICEEIPLDAHLVLGEAEGPRLVAALEEMLTADRRIVLDLRREATGIDESPLPRYDLFDRRHYGSMVLQMSRGCPFKCEFCDIPSPFGNRTRYKSVERALAELDLLYDWGWRDGCSSEVRVATVPVRRPSVALRSNSVAVIAPVEVGLRSLFRKTWRLSRSGLVLLSPGPPRAARP